MVANILNQLWIGMMLFVQVFVTFPTISFVTAFLFLPTLSFIVCRGDCCAPFWFWHVLLMGYSDSWPSNVFLCPSPTDEALPFCVSVLTVPLKFGVNGLVTPSLFLRLNEETCRDLVNILASWCIPGMCLTTSVPRGTLSLSYNDGLVQNAWFWNGKQDWQ